MIIDTDKLRKAIEAVCDKRTKKWRTMPVSELDRVEAYRTKMHALIDKVEELQIDLAHLMKPGRERGRNDY